MADVEFELDKSGPHDIMEIAEDEGFVKSEASKIAGAANAVARPREGSAHHCVQEAAVCGP